jgi:hypothetical protein
MFGTVGSPACFTLCTLHAAALSLFSLLHTRPIHRPAESLPTTHYLKDYRPTTDFAAPKVAPTALRRVPTTAVLAVILRLRFTVPFLGI